MAQDIQDHEDEGARVAALVEIGAATVRLLAAVELGLPAIKTIVELRKLLQGG